MGFLVRIVALLAVLAVVLPLFAGNTSLGQFVSAIWQDAAGFCSRRPDACAEGAAFVRDAGQLVSDTIHKLGRDADPGTLTDSDRNIVPQRPAAEAPQTSFASHGDTGKP